MQLLIVTPSHSTEGGAERILEAIARYLPSRGFDVTFALGKGARFNDADRFRRAFPMMRTIDVDGTSGTTFGRRRALRRAIVKTNADVVLSVRVFDVYPVCSALKLEGHTVRLTTTVQSFEPEYLVDVARYADFIDGVVTSGELTANAIRRFTSIDNVKSVPGGIAPPRRTRVPCGGPLRIGYVGRLEQVQKRILDLPLLVAELERRGVPFTLRLAGAGSMSDNLRAALPNAHFDGWVTTEALYDHVYPELDVFVHFADFEGLTIAPREAMAHGVVPVVSRFAGAEDFTHGENALTFPIGDISAAADAIERLHRDRVLLERLSAAARVSQSGDRSEQGAIDAWAVMLRRAAEHAPRVGSVLPPTPRDPGLLTRLHVPDAVAEAVRRLRRRKHADAGSEWPHWSGMHDPQLERALSEFAGGAAHAGAKS